MSIFCPKCGASVEDDMAFCYKCGFDILSYMNAHKNEPSKEERETVAHGDDTDASTEALTTEKEEPAKAETVCASADGKQTEDPSCSPTGTEQPENGNVAAPLADKPCATEKTTEVSEKDNDTSTAGKKSKKKQKKKKKLPFILRFLIAIVITAAVLLFLWWAVGNTVTLYIHSEDVLETLNSGSLELSGTENAYDELPNYIKDMMDDKYFEKEYGPVTTAMLPYLSAERTGINGWFGNACVEYKITAPDLESWLLNLDATLVTDENALLAMINEYIPSAPLRSAVVKINYNKKGFFSIEWSGNYYSREFADAVCGGFNSAYNVLYQRALEEINAALYGSKEAQ